MITGRSYITILIILVGLFAAGCTWITPPAQTEEYTQAPADCPVTIPNGRTPTGEKPFAAHHGNDAVVTALWPDGVVFIEPSMVMPDGVLGMKWPWWREVSGRLIIEGERLDAPAPPLDSDVSDGYGDKGFQPSGLLFPTEGCWQITGSVGEESLTFVTWVQLRQ